MTTAPPSRRGGPPALASTAFRAIAPGGRPVSPIPVDLDRLDLLATEEWYAQKVRVLSLTIPLAYREATLPADQSGRLAQRWLRAYRDGQRGGALVHGTVGTGKTWLAAAMMRELLAVRPGDHRLGAPVLARFVSTNAMLQSLRPGDDQQELDTYVRPPVLVLDDLGTERYTEWEAEQLFNLAHARSAAERPVVVTSNLAPPEISARYERRTVERLFAGALLVPMIGQSRRVMPEGF